MGAALWQEEAGSLGHDRVQPVSSVIETPHSPLQALHHCLAQPWDVLCGVIPHRQLPVTLVQTMGLEAARGAAYSMAAITDSKPAPAGSGEQISSTLGNLSVAELYEIMAQMKGLVQQNPPQVCH